jgi:16S rRNA (cytosine967-C5)-methyltransferase
VTVAATAKRPSSREVALETVRDVFGDERRGAQEAFDYRVRRAGLDARDRAFAAELAYGAIKLRRAIDWYLKPYLHERTKPLPPAIHEALRLGIYQLRFMGGVGVHAAVFETVNLALRHGHRGTAGLVNAVLRRFAADAPAAPQLGDFENDDEYRGVCFSVPTWVAARFREAFGVPATQEILAGLNAAPQHALRLELGRVNRDAIAAELAAAGLHAVPSPYVDEVLIVDGHIPDDPQGRFLVQSESSAMPVDILAPRPGERVVDLCSGRGHKTAQIAARLGGSGALESIELDAQKAQVQQALLAHFGATNVALVVGDANAVAGEADADAVLLDAPCSGLGVLGRHPEARWRKAPQDAPRHAVAQAQLLRTAARRVKRGGRLVYSVCSPDAREGSAIIEAFLSEMPAFSRGALPARYEPFLERGSLLIPPGIEGRDGFFIALLERRE